MRQHLPHIVLFAFPPEACADGAGVTVVYLNLRTSPGQQLLSLLLLFLRDAERKNIMYFTLTVEKNSEA